jgi:hypothetical protein
MSTAWDKMKEKRAKALKKDNQRFTKAAERERARLVKFVNKLTVIKGCGVKTNYGSIRSHGSLGCDIMDEFRACVNCRTTRRSPKCKQMRDAQQVKGRELVDGKLGKFGLFTPEHMDLPVRIRSVGEVATPFGKDYKVDFEMIIVNPKGKKGERVRMAYGMSGKYADGVKDPTYMSPSMRNHGHGDFYNRY